MKFKHTNIIPLQKFSYEIYLNFFFSKHLVSTCWAICLRLKWHHFKYLKPANDHLPDPRRSLAASVSLRSIAQANLEVYIRSNIRYSPMVEFQYTFNIW